MILKDNPNKALQGRVWERIREAPCKHTCVERGGAPGHTMLRTMGFRMVSGSLQRGHLVGTDGGREPRAMDRLLLKPTVPLRNVATFNMAATVKLVG